MVPHSERKEKKRKEQNIASSRLQINFGISFQMQATIPIWVDQFDFYFHGLIFKQLFGCRFI